jgi:type IV secretory pathway VirB2 component (pilin)
MKRLKLVILGLAAVVGIGFAFTPAVFASSTAAQNSLNEICATNPNASVCDDLDSNKNTNSEAKLSNTFRNVINALLFIIGIIAVIMIIVSGIKFTTAHGDSGAVTKARQTLIYSIVGLVIALLAFAIVNFVISRLG